MPLMKYILNGKSATEYANANRKNFEEDLNSSKKNPNNSISQKRIEYLHDILGPSAEHADKFEERIRQRYELFLSLPDNHPAEIVEGIPDIMCEACTIGKHCSVFAAYGDESTLEDEGLWLDAFLYDLNELNLPKPTITQEQAFFSDAEPQKARRIRTTMGAVKAVLKLGRSGTF